MEGTRRIVFTLWVIVTAKELVFRKPESFIMDARQVCLNFVLERAIIFILLDSKQICPSLQRKILRLCPKVVCSPNILEKITWNNLDYSRNVVM